MTTKKKVTGTTKTPAAKPAAKRPKPFKERIMFSLLVASSIMLFLVVAVGTGFLFSNMDFVLKEKTASVEQQASALTTPEFSEETEAEEEKPADATTVVCVVCKPEAPKAVVEEEPPPAVDSCGKCRTEKKEKKVSPPVAVAPVAPKNSAPPPRPAPVAPTVVVADTGNMGSLGLRTYAPAPLGVEIGTAYKDCPYESSCGQAMGLAGQWGAAAIGGGLYAYGQKLRRPDKTIVRQQQNQRATGGSAHASGGGGSRGPAGPSGPKGPPGDSPPNNGGGGPIDPDNLPDGGGPQDPDNLP